MAKCSSLSEREDFVDDVRRSINAGELFALADYLADHLGEDLRGCDCDWTMTRKWLAEHGLDVDASTKIILMLGGGCDCEIVYNFPYTKAEMAEKLLWSLDYLVRNPQNLTILLSSPTSTEQMLREGTNELQR
jgi:hypothetical protein